MRSDKARLQDSTFERLTVNPRRDRDKPHAMLPRGICTRLAARRAGELRSLTTELVRYSNFPLFQFAAITPEATPANRQAYRLPKRTWTSAGHPAGPFSRRTAATVAFFGAKNLSLISCFTRISHCLARSARSL